MQVNDTARHRLINGLRDLADAHRRESRARRALVDRLDRLEALTGEEPPIDRDAYRNRARLCDKTAPIYEDAAMLLEETDDPDDIRSIVTTVVRLIETVEDDHDISMDKFEEMTKQE